MGDHLNPPAFPEVPSDSNRYEGRCGMTLRDWFAGKALSHALSATASHSGCYDYVAAAHGAFEIADAMLAERAAPDLPVPDPKACATCGGLEYPCDDCIPF